MGELVEINQKILTQIPGEKGSIYKFLNSDSEDFDGFGELYFSSVNKNATKGWNMHKKAVCKLLVIRGEIEFVIASDTSKSETFKKLSLNEEHLSVLTIPKRFWFCFKGLRDKNLLMNFTNLKHDPQESCKKEIFKEHE